MHVHQSAEEKEALTKFRDTIPEYPYEKVMELTGMSRAEIDQSLDDILANLSEDQKKDMANLEELLDMEVDE